MLPNKNRKLTIIKSPMAHKTYSQEQIKFKYYKLFKQFTLNNDRVLSNLEGLKLLFNIRKVSYLNGLGTNLIFLKKVKVKIVVSESYYFKIINIKKIKTPI